MARNNKRRTGCGNTGDKKIFSHVLGPNCPIFSCSMKKSGKKLIKLKNNNKKERKIENPYLTLQAETMRLKRCSFI